MKKLWKYMRDYRREGILAPLFKLLEATFELLVPLIMADIIDVGIAEENAVALASGIAAAGGRPVYGVYSTFIQRTYDQLSQDLCINSSPATIIVAWASIYGMNFKFMPELDWTLTLGNGWDIPLGYIFAIGLMIFCSALTIWYFKYKKWL